MTASTTTTKKKKKTLRRSVTQNVDYTFLFPPLARFADLSHVSRWSKFTPKIIALSAVLAIKMEDGSWIQESLITINTLDYSQLLLSIILPNNLAYLIVCKGIDRKKFMLTLHDEVLRGVRDCLWRLRPLQRPQPMPKRLPGARIGAQPPTPNCIGQRQR